MTYPVQYGWPPNSTGAVPSVHDDTGAAVDAAVDSTVPGALDGAEDTGVVVLVAAVVVVRVGFGLGLAARSAAPAAAPVVEAPPAGVLTATVAATAMTTASTAAAAAVSIRRWPGNLRFIVGTPLRAATGRPGSAHRANGQVRHPATGCQSGRSTYTPEVGGTKVRDAPVGRVKTEMEVSMSSSSTCWNTACSGDTPKSGWDSQPGRG